MALSERDRRFAIFGGAAAGVLVLVFLVTRLLGGGGGEAGISFGPTAPGGGSPEPTVTPTATPSPVLSFGGRDPFAIPSVLRPPTTTPPPTGTSTPTRTPSPSPTTPGGGSSHTTRDGKTVVLIDTFRRGGAEQAQVQVTGSTYTVGEGDRFAGSFQMRSISGNCATIDYGDEGFTLCANPQK